MGIVINMGCLPADCRRQRLGFGVQQSQGTYVTHDFQSALGGLDSNGGWGVGDPASFSRIEVSFTGAGAWSGTSITYDLERQMTEIVKNTGGDQVLSNNFNVLVPTPSSDTVGGTYALSKDGTGTIRMQKGSTRSSSALTAA